MHRLTSIAFLLASFTLVQAADGQSASSASPILVENFEQTSVDDLPDGWGYARRDGELYPLEDFIDDRRAFYVVEEDGRKFVRGFTHGEHLRMSRAANGEQGGFTWRIPEYPRLRWQWRAIELPEGAREDQRRLNDTGGAVYVTFNTDWLGRPRSIKYTYSSTLPVGTVVNYGVLKVIVVSTGKDGYGDWITVQRDVMQDYKNVFGGTPPEIPLSITLWTDSTETGLVSKIDFDNIYVMPPVQPPGPRDE